jgi:hypothetical protein
METRAMAPRFVAPAGPDRALLSPSLLLCVAGSPTARTRYVSSLPALRLRHLGRKTWRGQRVTLSGQRMTHTPYRSFAPFSDIRFFWPRRTLVSHICCYCRAYEVCVCRWSLVDSASRCGPGGNAFFPLEPSIATAVPCAAKPCWHRDFCCVAPYFPCVAAPVVSNSTRAQTSRQHTQERNTGGQFYRSFTVTPLQPRDCVARGGTARRSRGRSGARRRLPKLSQA